MTTMAHAIKKSTLCQSFIFLDLQPPMQSVPTTNNVASSNPAHGEVGSVQRCAIKSVSDLRQVGGFLRVLGFPPPIKLTATILLKYC
jgi:hypothetical protein